MKKDRVLCIGFRSTLEILATVTLYLSSLKNLFSEESHMFLTASGCAVGFALLLGCMSTHQVPKKAMKLWLIAAICGAINMYLVGTMLLTNYIPMLFLYFPIALYFYFCGFDNIYFLEFSYYIYAFYLTYLMLNSYNNYSLSYAVSRNSLSTLLIICIYILQVSFEKRLKELPIRIIVVFFAACFIANGRGGIISAILLSVGYYFINIRNMNNTKAAMLKRMLLLLCFGLAVLYICFNFDFLFQKFLYRFSSSSYVDAKSTESRFYVWSLYITHLSDVISLVLGGNTYNLLPSAFHGNLHNSVLMLHACLGLAVCFYVCFVSYRSVVKTAKDKNYELCLLSVAFLIRAMTDRIFPAKEGDIVIWMIIFYANFPPPPPPPLLLRC